MVEGALSETLTAPPTPQVRILVVDDVEANVMLLSKMVKVQGHLALAAADGLQAIDKAKADKPDLILMDVMMPNLDGIEATRRLKTDPATRLIPICIVTALTDVKAKQSAIDAGADDFLSKPVDALELKIRIKALVAVKRTYDELEAARRRAADADRLKTDFLSALSHELRTPLTAISSAAKILLRHAAEKPETVAKFAPTLVEQSARMTRLLDEVLDLAKIEAGASAFREELFRADEMAKGVADMFAPIAEEKRLTLSFQGRATDPADGWVRGDRDRLTQVLVNLLSNATKFTPEGRGIRVLTARVPAPEAARWGVESAPGRGAVLVAVEDEGPGIPNEYQALVFDKFRQVADPAGGSPRGTGLGLAICREIVERHHGRIGVRSEVGKGSRFTLALPEAERKGAA